MLVPAVLFIILPILIFVYPGLKKGIDITGGTLVIVRTENTADLKAVEDSLAKFNLTELKIIPFSGGVQIQFGANTNLENVSNLIKDANSALKADPQRALNLCKQAYAEMQKLANVSAPENPEQCVAEAQNALLLARESFRELLNREIIKQFKLTDEQAQKIQYTEVSPALGALFWQNAIYVVILAAIAIVILMFIFFRELIPVIAILQAALFDVLCGLAILAILQVPLSITAISALLMLLGYSVDTDIMLTTRVLKGSGNPRNNAAYALKTGLTMTGTTIMAVGPMSLFSFIYGIDIIFTISIVLLFGLLGDLLSTWLMNAPIVLWYTERKSKVVR